MTDTWVRTAKRVLPGPLYSRARTWALRVLTWRRLMRQVRGAGPVDAVWLWASFLLKGTADILRDHIALNDLRDVEVVEGAFSESAGERIRASMPEGMPAHRSR
jgi:hypothetical protein